MHIIIIGSGIIGLTSAYQAVQQGYKVTMVEREHAHTLGASYQNGGQLSYSHAIAVSHAANLKNFIKATSSSKFVIEFSWREFMQRFAWFKALYQSKNKMAEQDFFAFSDFSRREFAKLKAELKYNKVSDSGTLHLFRNKKSLASFRDLISAQEEHDYQEVSVDQLDQYCADIKKEHFCGGVFCANDQSADARDFSNEIFAYLSKHKDFTFLCNSEIEAIDTNFGFVENILLLDGTKLVADKYVIAAGAYSSKLIERLGLASPIIPVKGYSSNLNNIKLKAAIIDSDARMVYTDLGKSVRVAGLYDFRGFSQDLTKVRERVFDKSLNSLFCSTKTQNREKLWYGFRSVSQDGFPVIGKSNLYSNLYYNMGHANLGWTLSAGSAKMLTDEIADEANNNFGFVRANRFNI